MAELPEITRLAAQMNETLSGKTIAQILLLQERCTNIPLTELETRLVGRTVKRVYHKGKWILTQLDGSENILLSLGMGADVFYFVADAADPEKYQVKLLFEDKTGYTIRFWWFGKYLIASDDELPTENNTKGIAIDPYDERFTTEYFENLLSGKKTAVKTFLMDQKKVGGIGNMYMHDILFRAGVHPQTKISELPAAKIQALYDGIRDTLFLSREKGAFFYESDFFGNKGKYGMDDFLVGYKEGQPCPTCGTPIELIKTGSTSSYICPKCQPTRRTKT